MDNRAHLAPCHCSDWTIGIQEIDDMIVHCSNHSAAPTFTAPAFLYCPWCGTRREVDKVYSHKYDSYFDPDTKEWIEEYSLWWKKNYGERPPTAIAEEVPMGV